MIFILFHGKKIMTHISYREGTLYIEDVSCQAIAKQFGTPTYVYSLEQLQKNIQAFQSPLKNKKHLIAYAVKANSNLAILQYLAKKGCGFDIVSGGELARVLKAGGDPDKVVFSGVGKTRSEIREALLANIHCFNIESESELYLIADIAKSLKKIAPIAFRVNPNIDPQTHPYIATGLKESKFGIDVEDVIRLYEIASTLPSISVKGIDCHIGSQITTLAPFAETLHFLVTIIQRLKEKNIILEHVDIGGGLGIPYQSEKTVFIHDYIQQTLDILKDHTDLTLILEPGRALIGNCGILLSRVLCQKHNDKKNFLIIDAGMNDLLRPALYDAWHNIIPVELNSDAKDKEYDVVGPVCETGDFLAKNRLLSIEEYAFLAICDVGAYGFSMRSQYNSRPGASEILIDGKKIIVIRERESREDLWRGEHLLC
jgi:diaminopimelate decarboxylase